MSVHWLDNSMPFSIIHYVHITAYTATRSESHGSWFVRVLVATFWKHSNHRDLESMFKIVSFNFEFSVEFYLDTVKECIYLRFFWCFECLIQLDLTWLVKASIPTVRHSKHSSLTKRKPSDFFVVTKQRLSLARALLI